MVVVRRTVDADFLVVEPARGGTTHVIRRESSARANLAELRALISRRGFRTSMRLSREDLRRLAVPTLMIWGERDPVVPRVHARAVAAEIPHARLEALAAGHVPQLGNPDRVATLLEDFVMAA